MGKIGRAGGVSEGPDFSVTLSDMEEVAMRAARALVGGAVETAAGEQAAASWGNSSAVSSAASRRTAPMAGGRRSSRCRKLAA